MPSPPPPKPKKEIGVDYMSSPEAHAYVGGKRWPLKKVALTKRVVDNVLKAVAEYDKVIGSPDHTDIEKFNLYSEASRKILEATLDDFEYDAEANNPDVGPALLGLLGTEVKDFLLLGGALGARHVQTRLAAQIGT